MSDRSDDVDQLAAERTWIGQAVQALMLASDGFRRKGDPADAQRLAAMLTELKQLAEPRRDADDPRGRADMRDVVVTRFDEFAAERIGDHLPAGVRWPAGYDLARAIATLRMDAERCGKHLDESTLTLGGVMGRLEWLLEERAKANTLVTPAAPRVDAISDEPDQRDRNRARAELAYRRDLSDVQREQEIERRAREHARNRRISMQRSRATTPELTEHEKRAHDAWRNPKTGRAVVDGNEAKK